MKLKKQNNNFNLKESAELVIDIFNSLEKN